MDLTEYRDSDSEKCRTEDLLKMISEIPDPGRTVLDIGARDGHFSSLLTRYFNDVTALDLVVPKITNKNVKCVQGDITCLDYPDDSFDFLFCVEVLEHIPTDLLEQACSELSRATRQYLMIGVPYKQDIRFGRTTCYSCGRQNPPWGHVNSFDRERLISLFPAFSPVSVSFVGESAGSTNALSTFLMDLAGNPYGTYEQEEGCIYCGEKLKQPPQRSFIQKLFTRAATLIRDTQMIFIKNNPNWIHVLFKKNS